MIVFVLERTGFDGSDILHFRALYFGVETFLQLWVCQQVLKQLVFAVVRSRSDYVAENLILALLAEADEPKVCDLAARVQQSLKNKDVASACGLNDEGRLAVVRVHFRARGRH